MLTDVGTRKHWRERWIKPRDTPEKVLTRIESFAAGSNGGGIDVDKLTVIGAAGFAEWLGVARSQVNAWRRNADVNGMPDPRFDLAGTGKSGSVDAWYLEIDLIPWMLERPRRTVTQDWRGMVITALSEIIAKK